MLKHICKWRICPCKVACFYCRQKPCGGACCRPLKPPPSSVSVDLMAAAVFFLIFPYPLGRICGGGMAAMTFLESIKNTLNVKYGKCFHCKHFKHANMPLGRWLWCSSGFTFVSFILNIHSTSFSWIISFPNTGASFQGASSQLSNEVHEPLCRASRFRYIVKKGKGKWVTLMV